MLALILCKGFEVNYTLHYESGPAERRLASLRSATRPARRRGVNFNLKTNAEYFDSIKYV